MSIDVYDYLQSPNSFISLPSQNKGEMATLLSVGTTLLSPIFPEKSMYKKSIDASSVYLLNTSGAPLSSAFSSFLSGGFRLIQLITWQRWLCCFSIQIGFRPVPNDFRQHGQHFGGRRNGRADAPPLLFHLRNPANG